MRIYFVETLAGEQRLLLCRWVEHFYEEGRKVCVLTDSTLGARHLDELLWTFSQGSFVPHRILSSSDREGPIGEPVVITTSEMPGGGFSILIFDGPLQLDLLDDFDAAVHFVLRDDEERLGESRLTWQTARDRGFHPQHVPYSANTRFPSLAAAAPDGWR